MERRTSTAADGVVRLVAIEVLRSDSASRLRIPCVEPRADPLSDRAHLGACDSNVWDAAETVSRKLDHRCETDPAPEPGHVV